MSRLVTMKREKWVVVRDTAGGGTEFVVGFEGS
jgi:hypothetical protein